MGSRLLRRPAGEAHPEHAMSAAAVSRECPMCGSAERRVYFTQRFAAIDQATPVTGYDVAVCQRCGAAYADGIPDQATFDRYYREMSKYEYAQRGGEESEYDSRRLALIASLIAPH